MELEQQEIGKVTCAKCGEEFAVMPEDINAVRNFKTKNVDADFGDAVKGFILPVYCKKCGQLNSVLYKETYDEKGQIKQDVENVESGIKI